MSPVNLQSIDKIDRFTFQMPLGSNVVTLHTDGDISDQLVKKITLNGQNIYHILSDFCDMSGNDTLFNDILQSIEDHISEDKNDYEK